MQGSRPAYAVAVLMTAILAGCSGPRSAASTGSEWAGWEDEYDAGRKSWKEIQAQIPAYPRPENLVPLEAGSETPHRTFIDVASISVGSDGVVRYTTVLRTAGGATNVTFEGMRCETREGKLYAIGHGDGTWARARNPQWQRILLRDLRPHQYVLYREYFCPSPATPTQPRVAIDALRRGQGLATARSTDE